MSNPHQIPSRPPSPSMVLPPIRDLSIFIPDQGRPLALEPHPHAAGNSLRTTQKSNIYLNNLSPPSLSGTPDPVTTVSGAASTSTSPAASPVPSKKRSISQTDKDDLVVLSQRPKKQHTETQREIIVINDEEMVEPPPQLPSYPTISSKYLFPNLPPRIPSPGPELMGPPKRHRAHHGSTRRSRRLSDDGVEMGMDGRPVKLPAGSRPTLVPVTRDNHRRKLPQRLLPSTPDDRIGNQYLDKVRTERQSVGGSVRPSLSGPGERSHRFTPKLDERSANEELAVAALRQLQGTSSSAESMSMASSSPSSSPATPSSAAPSEVAPSEAAPSAVASSPVSPSTVTPSNDLSLRTPLPSASTPVAPSKVAPSKVAPSKVAPSPVPVTSSSKANGFSYGPLPSTSSSVTPSVVAPSAVPVAPSAPRPSEDTDDDWTTETDIPWTGTWRDSPTSAAGFYAWRIQFLTNRAENGFLEFTPTAPGRITPKTRSYAYSQQWFAAFSAGFTLDMANDCIAKNAAKDSITPEFLTPIRESSPDVEIIESRSTKRPGNRPFPS